MASRLNRRRDGTQTFYLGHLRDQMKAHLPETLTAFRDQQAKHDPWVTLRVRPEVVVTVAALAQRFRDRTGRDITKSEVLAAALSEFLPDLTRSIFPGVAGADEA